MASRFIRRYLVAISLRVAAAAEAAGTMPIADVNRVQLHYRCSGAGEALILVHGSWVDGDVWSSVVPRLSPSLEVVTYDRRGHTRSSCPPGQGSIHDDVGDLAALIEALAVGPAHVAGASLGGSICLRLAAARPELLQSVAAHEPPLFDLLDGEDTELSALRRRLGAVAERLEAGDAEGGARIYFDQIAETPGGWEGLDRARRDALLGNAPTYLDQCRDPEAIGIDADRLAAYGGPVLLTYGDRRPPLFRRIVEMVAAELPAARTELIPGAAHDPQVTHAEAYVERIEGFLRTPIGPR